jgi:hypothetical protein
MSKPAMALFGMVLLLAGIGFAAWSVAEVGVLVGSLRTTAALVVLSALAPGIHRVTSMQSRFMASPSPFSGASADNELVTRSGLGLSNCAVT